ncbi:MAG: hypothetical protein AAF203_05620, partial [Pseudomonadota bacterium]
MNALEDYCKQCQREGSLNNTSPQKMKIGRFKGEKWWIVYDQSSQKIVSAAGTHPLPQIGIDTWRIMHRLATLRDFRAKAGPIGSDQRSCFGWGRLLPYQVAYCKIQGARKIVFTTNADEKGDPNSLRQNRVCELVFEKKGMAKKIATTVLFGVTQNIWQVGIQDVYSKKSIS